MERQRLDKLLAAQGAWSRRDIRELVRAGQVTVNGSPALGADQKITVADKVLVRGRAVALRERLYLMMNKPAGVVCATRDRERTVLDILEPAWRRDGLFPAGRLDRDTEGFLLLTDDGDFAHRMLSPKSHVPKTYRAVLDGPVDGARLVREFAAGLLLDGGDRASPAELRVLENGHNPVAELTIYEGMYHQVKRMFALFDLRVLHLKRVKIGNLPLDPGLAPGKCREILNKELTDIC